jgi:hypothetical protein
MPAFGLGDTFYGGREIHGDDHLWLVINDPNTHAGVALIVNITTLEGSFVDRTCLVDKREHPFVTHPSYVRFIGARGPTIIELDAAERLGKIRRRPQASTALLDKVRLAAISAPLLNPTLRKLL